MARRQDVEQPKPGVAAPQGDVQTAPQQGQEMPKLKVSLWDRMGGAFRAGTIGAGAVGATYGLASLLSWAFSAAPVSLAVAQGVSFAAATFMTGGIGFVLAGAALLTQGISAVVRAANPKLREKMNKKGLIRSLTRSLSKNKKLQLTDEQKKMLGEILADKDMVKYIEKLGKGFNKKDKSELLQLIKQVHEHGHTDVRNTEQGTGRGAADPEQPDRTPGPDRTPPGPDRTPPGPDRTPGGQTNEDVYARILTKNIFTANLSAREWLALQQIYAAEKKAAKERVDALSGIENPTPDQQKALEEAQDVLKKVTILERRAYNAARARAGAEAADPNNNISEEQRRSLQDFANRGRRSTEAKKVITEEDHRTAREAREQLDKIVTERKNKPKSGGR